MSANDSNFTTTIGTRIRNFSTNQAFANRTPYISVDISCIFFNHSYAISLSSWTINNSYHGWKKPLPEILAPGAENWTDDEWVTFFAQFKNTHQGLLPNAIIVEFHDGYGMVCKDFTTGFDASGHLLYAEVETNEGSICWDGFFQNASQIYPKDEASLTSLIDLESYIKAHQKGE